MADGKCGDFILSTIDQLRNRKARPDLDRICHMVQRNYGLNSSLVLIELEKLIVENRVIKVDYKGNTSYRNAAKWTKTKKMDVPSNNESTEIKNVENTIVQVQPVKRQGPGRPRKHPLIPPRPEGAPKPPRGRPPGKKKPFTFKMEKRRPGRPPGSKSSLTEHKEKQYLHQLDQHLNNNSGECLVSSTLTVPGSLIAEQIELCAYCQSTSSRNLKGEYEALLRCKDCKVTAHPSCMEYTPELAAKSRLAPWQCMSCKNCAVCGDQGNGDTMLFCDSCDKGYHMGCHNPAVLEKPNGLWKCCKCQDNCSNMYSNFQTHPSTVKQRVVNLMRPSNIEVDTTGLPTPCDSPTPSDEWKDSDNNTTIAKQYPQAIPDPKDWSIDEVAAFFFSLGFVEQASVFIEQEIDGKSLLLLKRNDVLTGLSIKLGPALKIYSHVEKLQKGVSDRIMHF